MGKTLARYNFETKASAASDMVNEGMGRPEAMKSFRIAGMSPLKMWRRLYRGCNAEMLRPKSRRRPRESDAKPAESASRSLSARSRGSRRKQYS